MAALITSQAQELSDRLDKHRRELFPPKAEKPLRAFQLHEVAKFLGVKSGYLRNLSLERQRPPCPQRNTSGRRSYTAGANSGAPSPFSMETGRATRRYLPHRRGNETSADFGSRELQRAAAARRRQPRTWRNISRSAGIGCSPSISDPQASLSALCGLQPELDIELNELLYGAIRYDEEARPLLRRSFGARISRVSISFPAISSSPSLRTRRRAFSPRAAARPVRFSFRVSTTRWPRSRTVTTSW